jgi:hypothetical protein
MNAVVPKCRNTDQRLDLVRARGRNGIDYLDAEHNARVLNVYLLREAPDRITTNNVRITGGVRVRDIRVIELRIGPPGGAVGDARFQVVVDRPGDLSTYRLSLVETDALGVPTGQPMAEFDPLYASIDFTFRERRTTQLDCKTEPWAPPVLADEPDINYLAKDYASFRQLILDRMALTMPQWQESHVPDIGIALVEILAYVGDYLSYYQDAVATEAYLNTARKRVSVRRHLRLLDYRMHDGCNARTWLCLNSPEANPQLSIDADSVFFISADDAVTDDDIARLLLGDLASVAARRIDVFEPVLPQPMQIRGAHAAMSFYCWGNAICELPAGSTRATLCESLDNSAPPQGRLSLRAGDFLCFEEVKGVATGQPMDADPTRRHVVRLTRVEASADVLSDPPVPLVEIEWAREDALPFPLVLSAIGPAPGCVLIEDISIARGNVFLIDEGVRIVDEDLGQVPLLDASAHCVEIGAAVPGPVTAGPYQPTLDQAGLISTQQVAATVPARSLLDQDPALALPWIRLRSIPGRPDGWGPLFQFKDLKNPDPLIARIVAPPDGASWFLRTQLSSDTRRQLGGMGPGDPLPAALRAQIIADLQSLVRQWVPRQDLLNSRSGDPDFVVELDDDGFASLRFGDGVMGRAPAAGETFSATYRVGLDAAGHLGAESITRALFRPGTVAPGELTPRNPLAASGRFAPQSIAEARTIGPGTTSELARAVTADDYAELAQRNPRVQRAAAVLLWTGNRYEARVAIDPLGSEAVDDRLLRGIETELEQYRSIGHDLVVVPPTYVPIDLCIIVQVIPGHSRTHVERELRDAFSNRVLPDGSRGFFHPDNLTFGQDLEVGRVMAAAQAVSGVQSVQVKTLERMFPDPGQQLADGILAIGPMKVARLDNTPSQPENGRLIIELRGGQ